MTDDRKEIRNMALSLSETYEFIATANDGRDLVNAGISLLPNVIVSDLSMPQLTGIQAMQELRARGIQIPFLSVSSEPARFNEGTISIIDKLQIHAELVPGAKSVSTGKQYSPLSCDAEGSLRLRWCSRLSF